jgi:putative RecB family exonuclease
MSAAKGPRPTPRNQFSFSRVKTFAQCPLRYRYRYLKGLREAFTSVEAHLGTTVHGVVEWMYGQRDQSSSPSLDLALEELSRQWQERWSDRVAVIRVNETPESYLRQGREMLEVFMRVVFSRDRSETVALEKRLSARLSDEVVFTGVADRIGRTVGGRPFVIDYKTSSREGDSSDLSEGLQVPLYASCILEDHATEDVLAGYHYLRHGSTRWNPVGAKAAEDVRGRFLALATEARTATDFPARPGPLCPWCGFNATCPEARVADHLSGGQRHGS